MTHLKEDALDAAIRIALKEAYDSYILTGRPPIGHLVVGRCLLDGTRWQTLPPNRYMAAFGLIPIALEEGSEVAFISKVSDRVATVATQSEEMPK